MPLSHQGLAHLHWGLQPPSSYFSSAQPATRPVVDPVYSHSPPGMVGVEGGLDQGDLHVPSILPFDRYLLSARSAGETQVGLADL